MLGQEVGAAARRTGHGVVACDHAGLDVTDAEAVRARLEAERPDAVVNCAAYTNVDGAEEEREAAFRLNGEAPGIVSGAAASVGAKVVHLSSDYVFDGAKGEPYVESDAPSPLSAYGRSKLAGERATAEANPHHFVVRSSWLFGANGANFVGTMLRLGREREELRVVDDQVGSPTWTGHLALALLGIAAGGEHGIHHVAGGGECSWCGFAREIFRQASVDCEVRPITT